MPTPFTFVETPLFTQTLPQYLDDDEYAKLQRHLNQHPDAGAVVRGSGGVRKVRWAAEGRGKRGGLRVIYFLRLARGEIWMLSLYGKNVRENVPAHLLKQMRGSIENAKDE